MKKLNFLIITISIVLSINISVATAKTGVSRTYLEQMPLERIVDLYTNHVDAVANPKLRDYATFFKTNEDLFDQIMQTEEEAEEDNYVFYHAANGPRLVFDTLKAIHQIKNPSELPDDFVVFRDSEDPKVAVDNVWNLLTSRWPLLFPDEKKSVLTAIFEQELSDEQVRILWSVLWGDLDYTHELQPAEKLQVAALIGDQFDHYLQIFRALKSDQWQKWTLSDEQRGRILATRQKIQTSGNGDLLLMMQALDDAFDFDTDFRPRNIAVNLSLFSGCVLRDRKVGLYPSQNECTPLYWFATDLGPHQYEKNQELRRDLLEAVFKRHHIPMSEIDELEKIYSTLEPVDDQQLFQIFVPKVMSVDRQGRPEPLIDQLFYLSHKIGRPAYYLGKKRPSEILETYHNDPSQIPGFLQLQGRLLFTKHGLLNAQSGIRMRTYYLPGACQQRITAYQDKLKQWSERVLRYWFVSQAPAKAPVRFGRCNTVKVQYI